jgi:hypothetical protein
MLRSVQPAPSVWLVVATRLIGAMPLLVGLVASLSRARWFVWLGAFGTLVHEAGHAAAAVVTGGGVSMVNVSSPDEGFTYTWYRSWGSEVLTLIAGFAAPPLAGLGAAALLAEGRVAAVLMATVAGIAILLIVARGLMTIATVVIAGGLAFAALRWGGPVAQQSLAYTLAWLLLIHEISGVLWLFAVRWWGVDPDDEHDGYLDDADGLAEVTFLPAPIWILGWAALAGWALWVAVPLLWP